MPKKTTKTSEAKDITKLKAIQDSILSGERRGFILAFSSDAEGEVEVQTICKKFSAGEMVALLTSMVLTYELDEEVIKSIIFGRMSSSVRSTKRKK